MGKQHLFTLSMFDSVKNANVTEQIDLRFDEFCEGMQSYSEDEYASKEAAPLFASTWFMNKKRCKANAKGSGLVVLDIDHGQTIDDTWDIVEDLDIAALLYSTASHRDDHHKFRLCIPLTATVRYERYVECWHALDHVFIDGMSDASKKGCESLFYVPGQYPNAPTVFKSNKGMILSAEEWFDVADLDDIPFDKPCRNKADQQQTSQQSTNFSAISSSDLDIYETRLVTESALNKYQSSIGDWHHARFGLMMSIIGRAKRLRLVITNYDIIHLFNQVDQLDGGHYQTPKYQKEIANDAANALAQAL